MKQQVKELINSLYLGKINKNEFLQIYFEGKSPDSKRLSELLKKGIVNEDRDIIEEAIVLLYTNSFPNSLFTNHLSELLLAQWHTKHEDIVSLLKDIANLNTIESLYEVTKLKLEYLDYDDTFQLARKSIKALSQINDKNAISKLKLILNDENEVISNYAKKELLKKGVQY